jgi:3-hexulose-6-phosphate synthase/6-phospho-3-hexuloisomerase
MSDLAIQLALDVTSLNDAVSVASQVSDLVDRIEIGTLLLRRNGIRAIEVLRDHFSDFTLIADCKIMDCGGTNSALALDAGANGVVVQAVAPRATLEAACNAASQRGGFVMADSLGVTDVQRIGEKIRDLPISHMVIHKGKDEQAIDNSLPIAAITQAASLVDLPPLAVAGGISPENISDLIGLPRIEVLIVGDAIVTSNTPREVVSRLRALLY